MSEKVVEAGRRSGITKRLQGHAPVAKDKLEVFPMEGTGVVDAGAVAHVTKLKESPVLRYALLLRALSDQAKAKRPLDGAFHHPSNSLHKWGAPSEAEGKKASRCQRL